MRYAELDLLRLQAAELTDVLRGIGPDDWTRPTRCTEFDLRELVGHLGGALTRYGSLAQADEVPEETHDRIKWWSTRDPVERSPIIAKMTKELVGERPGTEIAAFAREAAQRLTDALDRDPADLVGGDGVGIRAGELAAVAVLESGVHTMDIGHALGVGERLDPRCARLIVSVLDEIRGEPLPPQLGWDPRTYVLTATGRRGLNAAERWTLGLVADRFPLIQ